MTARAWGPLLALSLPVGAGSARPKTTESQAEPHADTESVTTRSTRPRRTWAAGGPSYRQHCELCHGKEGRGDGPSAKLHTRNARPPQDLTRPEIQANMTDGEIFWKIGVGFRPNRRIVMPSFSEEIPSVEDRWRVVLFVRTLELKDQEVPQ